MKLRHYLADRQSLIFFVLFLIVTLVGIPALDQTAQLSGTTILYMLTLGLALLVLYVTYDCYRSKQAADAVAQAVDEQVVDLASSLPKPRTQEQVLYHRLLDHLQETAEARVAAFDVRQREHADFINAWVHEIKTPIAALKLTLEAHEADLTPELSASLDEEVQRIEEYVQKVLYFSRLTDFASDYLITHVKLETVVKESVKKHMNLFIHKRIAIKLDQLDVEVATDRKWIGFVIDQLIGNALKYTQSGGMILISSARTAHETVLQIEDNGVGIAPEDLPRLFERSFTGQGGRWHHGATGFGLYLSKQMTERLRHGLDLHSELGHGTRAIVRFPNWADHVHVTRM